MYTTFFQLISKVNSGFPQALANQKGIYIYISEQASASHYAGCLYQGFNLTVTQATQKPSNIFANMENKNWSFEKLVVDK